VRVLHVTPYFAPAFRYGGPPRAILGLCKALQAAGVEVRVFTTTAGAESEPEALAAREHHFEGVPVAYFPLSPPRRHFASRQLAQELARQIHDFDVVHVHGLWNLASWAGARAARAAGVPYLVSPRGMLDPGSLARRRLLKHLVWRVVERRNLKQAVLLHATSDLEERGLAALCPSTPRFVLANGVESPPSAAPTATLRGRHGIPAGAPLVAFLGRLHPQKRLDLVLAAFERVRRRAPEARLLLAGPLDGYRRAELDAILSDSAGAATWLGALAEPEKWSLLSEANLLLLCSDSESFGLSVAEALAVGTPVVVSRTCPWPELETLGCGFWVEQSAEALAEAALRLLRDPVEARAMGARGQELIRLRHSWPPIGRRMAERYAALPCRSPR
jgi:glycosyltransferase involved in cell wall biosynthesis